MRPGTWRSCQVGGGVNVVILVKIFYDNDAMNPYKYYSILGNPFNYIYIILYNIHIYVGCCGSNRSPFWIILRVPHFGELSFQKLSPTKMQNGVATFLILFTKVRTGDSQLAYSERPERQTISDHQALKFQRLWDSGWNIWIWFVMFPITRLLGCSYLVLYI